MKKVIIKRLKIVIAIIALLGVTGIVFDFFRKVPLVEAAKKLEYAVSHHDYEKVKEIVAECPESINVLPSLSPWWYQVITEQRAYAYSLQSACWSGEYETIKFLIDNGADVNLVWKGIEGSKSPLQYAILSNPEDLDKIVDLLLEKGADITYVDYRGNTAYDYAVEKGNLELAERIKP